MKKRFCRIFSAFLLACIVASSVPVSAQTMSEEIKHAEEYLKYSDYLNEFTDSNESKSHILGVNDIETVTGETEIKNNYFENNNKSILVNHDSSVTYKTNVPDGWYTLKITYCIEQCRAGSVQMSFAVNDKVPFTEANNVAFYGTYIDEKGIVHDYYGNDIRSTQILKPMWITTNVYDTNHYESEPLKFNLKNGDKLTITVLREMIAIASIELVPAKKINSYKEYIKLQQENGAEEIEGTYNIYEAENYNYKSDPTLVPTTDNSFSTVPHDNFKVKLNNISGGKWKTAGQFISWNVKVDKSGLYNITLKAKQNTRNGLYSTRRLYVNGVVPFEEANNLKFTYSRKWQNYTLGSDEPWLIYLNKGDNEIKLEATLGEMGPVLRRVDNILDNLNEIYRDILTITGSSPDQYRDYRLDKLIPDSIKNISVQKQALAEVLEEITRVSGQKGGDMSIFDTLIKQLGEFEKDSDNIPAGFNFFKTNIGSLGTWITSALEQPLSMDSLIISSENIELQSFEGNFFERIYDSILSFLASFVVDYNNIGNLAGNTEKPIVVWMTSGRDQMQVLKTMIQNSFVSKTGINVQLENVEVAAVLKAVAAGNGPDALLGGAAGDPVNYALRNAVYDLNSFENINEVKARFYSESLVPYTFGGKLYALPETLSFNLIFYRTDILNELDLKVPETWDDVIITASVLQKNNMTFGLPSAINTYESFMYQYGGKMYTDDGKSCLLSSVENSNAFEFMTDFFKNYSLELSYNFVNRFRTAEIPIAVDSIEAYNNLKVSAPEIEGLWGIATLPAIKDTKGNLNRAGSITGTACMIFSDSKYPEKAYEFLSWWTEADTQSDFGKEIESILGPSSRYLTANREAFEKLPWTDKELAVIKSQLEQSKAVPQVPGSYFIGRHFNNAFRAVVISNKDIKDTLEKYTEVINEELEVKRKEFGLD